MEEIVQVRSTGMYGVCVCLCVMNMWVYLSDTCLVLALIPPSFCH